MAENQDLQKEYADDQGGVSVVFKTKLRPTFIEPFKVVAKKGLACTLNLPKKMRTHPVFYVGLLKLYRDLAQVSAEGLTPGRHVVAEPREAGQQQAAGPQLGDLTLQVCDPVRTRLRKLGDLPLQVHNPVVNHLRGLNPVHPQLHFIEIYRLAVNVDVRVVAARVDRAKTLFQRGQGAVTRGASIQLRLGLLRLCSMSVMIPTITWNALWRGVVAKVVSSTW
ncbi:hypothetical protein PC113_g15726 [Phytophthora cactorum]|uniref:Tf2-1-like SH3-like domain-containing protein n=1 Tax=Phytophthora cactorum TaxID=29920 RepID=A0A8T0YGD3_9STRA|nr:hypothetical protein PC112_g15397 [Phytophthora cactorum]KAG2851655.1 hypothetical protein PC113_g15726 [Phytophthora cactorum]KAG2904015.1 hypothetical protein PC115_g15136 [Phytophthora cactorum]